MCGLEIIQASHDENVFNCALTGRNGSFDFTLTAVRSDGTGDISSGEPNLYSSRDSISTNGNVIFQYIYSPAFLPSSAIASRLPAYLLEEIAFDADQLQPFFWRALNFLMSLSSK
jgi:hypothetical protein